EPLFQGAFIWDFIDQSLIKKNRYGEEFQAYGGDFNDRPCDYNFSGDGILYADRKSSPKLQTVKFNYQNIAVEVYENKVKIVNKNLFTGTDDYDCTATLEKNGIETIRTPLIVNIPPLCEAEYTLPFSVPYEPGVYCITISFTLNNDKTWANKGYEVAFGQTAITRKAPETPCIFPVNIVKGGQNIGIHGKNFSSIFSKSYGGLMSYNFDGRELFKYIPMPNFWRAPTDNDKGNQMPARYAQWKLASLYASPVRGIENPTLTELKTSAEIIYKYNLPTSPTTVCTVKYTVTGDGTVQVNLSCFPQGLPPMPEFGMMFRLDADYKNLEWFGLGPEETYIDKKTGARLGIYHNSVADNMAKYLVPQECGNKVGVRYVKLTDNTGRGILFEADGEMEFSALPYTPHEMENAMHSYELPNPNYTVVRINMRQMGVGGDNSWGAPTHDEYLLPVNQLLEFTFRFKGIK
ncbi:MAG: DUF4981 domain-containing protein, partial [Clostridiales bacterium]|nr:DUF4981 domain-containing protein [Clostridiales bacterium]